MGGKKGILNKGFSVPVWDICNFNHDAEISAARAP